MATERTFLITGVSKRIVRALSQRLADAGHHVVGVARGKDLHFSGTLASIDLDDNEASGKHSPISPGTIPLAGSS